MPRRQRNPDFCSPNAQSDIDYNSMFIETARRCSECDVDLESDDYETYGLCCACAADLTKDNAAAAAMEEV